MRNVPDTRNHQNSHGGAYSHNISDNHSDSDDEGPRENNYYRENSNYNSVVPQKRTVPSSSKFSTDNNRPTMRNNYREGNSHDGPIRCDCGLESKILTAKTGENSGREYAACVKSAKKCKFWLWLDGRPNKKVNTGTFSEGSSSKNNINNRKFKNKKF